MIIKKQDIVRHLKETHRVTIKDGKKIVDEIFSYMIENLKQGNEISIIEFFKMGTKLAKSRNTYHPRTKQRIGQHIYNKVYCSFTARFRQKIKALKNTGE